VKYTLDDGASVTFGSFRHSRGLAAQASPVECGSDLVAQARSSDDGRCVLALLGVQADSQTDRQTVQRADGQSQRGGKTHA
jgi:hypothetical protein